jgi:hypothetical protein
MYDFSGKLDWKEFFWQVGHVRFCLLDPGQETDMSKFSRELDSK